MDSAILELVADIELNPPDKDKYKTFKKRICEQFSSSKRQKIQQLISTLDLGNKRPSQLLREMKNLAGGDFPDNLLRNLWIQRLPQQMQAVLSVGGDDLNQLATLAGKIAETSTNQINSSRVSGNSSHNELIQQIAVLIEKIERLSRSKSHDPQPRQHSLSRTRSNSRNREYENCWYHYKFGNRAKRCKSPCKFNSLQGN